MLTHNSKHEFDISDILEDETLAKINDEIQQFMDGFKKESKTEQADSIAPLEARIQYFFHVLKDFRDFDTSFETSRADIVDHFMDVFDDVIYHEHDEDCDDCAASQQK